MDHNVQTNVHTNVKTVTVQLPQGEITGTRLAQVSRFSSVPYAQPAVGPLRFAPPVPARWAGTLDATQPMPVCPQLASRLRGVMGDFQAQQSEDCLRLTVWTPSADTRKRPVVIWLHGGAWQSGGGAVDWYDGARLAARGDIVVVGVNYRLAALGWLYVPGETANVGLLDEEAAIRWVVEHIAHFGGDPEQITLMGHSAGAFNIAAMLTRQPQFQRAILHSASLGRGFREAKQAAYLSGVFLKAAGAEDLAQARSLPLEALFAAQQSPAVAQALKEEGANRSLFCPVVDGEIFPSPVEPLMQTACAAVDVLVGSTLNEMAAFPGMSINEQSQQLGEQIFRAPGRQWATNARTSGRQAWSFSFDYAPNPEVGACHCIDLPFVFGNLDAFAHAPMLRGMVAEHAALLVDQLQTAWIEFVHGRSPGWEMAPAVKVFK
ncbi:MAG: carboxylesterase family protein [Sheuella sp.]|nr:carboxylesterase family protein [Sheuella sp.]